MGDLTWLANLGPGQLAALAIALVAIGLSVPRWVMKGAVQREQQISEQWKTLYFSEIERGNKATEIVAQQTEAIKTLTAAVEAASWAGTGRHRAVG